MNKLYKILLFILCISFMLPVLQAVTVSALNGAVNPQLISLGNSKYVFTVLCGSMSSQPVAAIGSINPEVNETIRILGVGMGGDIDAAHGPVNGLRFSGAGLTYSWMTGSSNTLGADLFLGYTHMGILTNTSLNLLATLNQTIYIEYYYHSDYDAEYTSASDPFGNYFNDSAYPSSIRSWVYFETTVPEPSAAVCILMGVMAIFVLKRK